MNAYRVKLADYLLSQKAIAQNFFSAAAAAEETCESATHSLTTNTAQNAAQATFKAEIRTASEIHNAAIKALGPRPTEPIVSESNGISHETHKLAPYGNERDLVAS